MTGTAAGLGWAWRGRARQGRQRRIEEQGGAWRGEAGPGGAWLGKGAYGAEITKER
jgi:hypothetical protein